MAAGTPNPQLLVGLAGRIDEAASAVRETAEALALFRGDLPRMGAQEICRRAEDFEKMGADLGRKTAEVRSLAFRITRGEQRLSETLAGYPASYREEVVRALERLRKEAAALKSGMSCLGYVAGTHIVYLDALLRCVGEATGLEATYHPRKPAMPSANMGIVDKTA